jgi:hypothetical protein
MNYEIIGADKANGPDKIAFTIQNKIYEAYGLTREQVETKENEEALETFKKINGF